MFLQIFSIILTKFVFYRVFEGKILMLNLNFIIQNSKKFVNPEIYDILESEWYLRVDILNFQ